MRSTDIYRFNDSYDICDDEICCYMADVVVAPEEITDIEQKTREPSRDLSLWKRMRALCISASSKAHSVLRSRKEPSVLAKSFLTERRFWSVETTYGTDLENEAILAFCELMSAEVQRCGLCIMLEQRWLCFTPDGLVRKGTEVSLLEVKCPHSCREKPIINVEEQVSNVPYLVFRDNELLLKKSHVYYTQVQVSLYVLGLEKCFFFVYSRHQQVVEVVADKDFLLTSIPRLEKFYFTHHLPAITKTLRAVR
ncbi:hypothetical protein HPB48_010804 [Haemaphysalis longicornis]|uniref:YqaJ viral recombinase domain-containing protein n=1 Tax=Haemaphysalis longicornis TaxID=44386 RepID=A0A9J6G9U7_HAELO|nr:hypothetical protein HPB48_010804 [Haemaphysalis longicornis]